MTISRLSPPRRTAGAFTLLEMMLVVAIIALLLASAIYYMGPQLFAAQDVRVRSDISSITTALRTYQGMNGNLPTTEQGLQSLVTRPTTEPKPLQWHQGFDKIPKDPWGSEYNYSQPGKHNPSSFDLYSAGPDRKADTADDIGNWDNDK
jgi:general secretion pathway protein G